MPALLSLQAHLELLGWLVRVVSLGSNFSDPGVFRGLLFVEDKHDIACHSFIGNDDFLTTINDEIAALVKSAFLGIPGNLGVTVNVTNLAVLRSDHYWDLPEVNFHRGELLNGRIDLFRTFFMAFILSIKLESS